MCKTYCDVLINVKQGNLDFTDSAQHGLMTQLLR